MKGDIQVGVFYAIIGGAILLSVACVIDWRLLVALIAVAAIIVVLSLIKE